VSHFRTTGGWTSHLQRDSLEGRRVSDFRCRDVHLAGLARQNFESRKSEISEAFQWPTQLIPLSSPLAENILIPFFGNM
jgi:hypothetical protein